MIDLHCIAVALQTATTTLGSDNPRLEAEILLAHVLDKPRSHLFAWPEKTLNTEQQHHFDTLIAQRKKGQPIAYLIGKQEFWSLPLQVSQDTLIPRPETELLVAVALNHLQAQPGVQSTRRILDLGTGSGAIALAIATECPQTNICACDNSAEALFIARQNAQSLGISNVRFLLSDWFSALADDRFDIILSNPPYIAQGDRHLDAGDVMHEPRNALVSGHDGLDAIRHIVVNAMPFLANKGVLAVEHSFNQGRTVRAIFQQQGFIGVQSQRDLQKLERVSFGWRRA